MIGIYKITSPSGKAYIGQSWEIEKRWMYYRYIAKRSRQMALVNSFGKYGYDAHKFEVIHELPPDVEQSVMDTYEQFYMDASRAAGVVLMNCKEAGSTGKLSENHKKAIKTTMTGRKHSDETKERMSEWQIGKQLSQSTKNKIGSANKGKKRLPEHILKSAAANRGVKRSQEFKDRVSKRFKGVRKSEDHRAALSLSRIEKGTASGENNPRSKVTEAMVIEIRTKYKVGCTLTQLYKEYGMSKSGMHSILSGKNWPGIGPE